MNAKVTRPALSAALAAACVAVPAARGAPTSTTLATFAGTAGSAPAGDLVADAAGNLYGTTAAGGAHNDGTVFELSGTNHQTLTTLLSFAGGTGGMTPNGGLVLDASGDLFGTTQAGGMMNGGTAFELSGTGATRTLTSLAQFGGPANGSDPRAGLVADASGNLYGTTSAGGSPGAGGGTVFELAGTNHTLTTLAALTATTGTAPLGKLAFDTNGNLYGTASAGGASGRGTVFQVTAAAGPMGGRTATLLFSFNASTGSAPAGGLLAASGLLYGTTQAGGAANDGTVYQLSGGTGTAAPTTLTTLASFAGTNGSGPSGPLTVDGAGDLFGTTATGGAGGYGTVFELPASAPQTVTTLHSFAGGTGDGATPLGGVTVNGAGLLFGTTSAGGSAGAGTAFLISGFPVPIAHLDDSGYATVPANPGPGVRSVVVGELTIFGGGGRIVFPTAAAGSGRQVLVPQIVDQVGGSGQVVGSRIDLSNNDADFPPNQTYLVNLQGLTYSAYGGYDDGRWDGAHTAADTFSLDSAAAGADPTRTTALGVIQNNQGGTPIYTAANPFDGVVPGAADVLVKYTYYGDANLDGKVDGRDYAQIDAGYLSGGYGWYNGDFNYDGVINASDFTLIDNAYNNQTANLSAAVLTAGGTDEVAAVAVPEPAGSPLAVAGLVGLVGRRRAGRRLRPGG